MSLRDIAKASGSLVRSLSSNRPDWHRTLVPRHARDARKVFPNNSNDGISVRPDLSKGDPVNPRPPRRPLADRRPGPAWANAVRLA